MKAKGGLPVWKLERISDVYPGKVHMCFISSLNEVERCLHMNLGVQKKILFSSHFDGLFCPPSSVFREKIIYIYIHLINMLGSIRAKCFTKFKKYSVTQTVG